MLLNGVMRVIHWEKLFPAGNEKNIKATFPQVKFDSDTRRGIYGYLKSFYEMEGTVDAVNKRVDLLLGKTNQITEIGEVVVTPEKKKGNQKKKTPI